MNFDHIGLVVHDLQAGRSKLQRMMSIQSWTQEFTDPANGVRCQFGRDAAGIFFELIEPLGQDSPVAGALARGRAVLNHVAYRVHDLAAAGEHLRAEGCAPTGDPKPAIAYGGRPVQFFLTPLNFLIELIEAAEHQHLLSDPSIDCMAP